MKKALVLTIIIILTVTVSSCGAKMEPNTVFSADDMKGREIGVVLNSAAKFYADGRGTLHEYTTGETMLVDLKNGAIDCAVMDESTAKPLLSKVSGLKILRQPLIKSDFSFVIAKENPDLTKAVNGALKTLDEDGTLKKIVDGYLTGNGYRYSSPGNVDLSAGSLILAVDNHFPPYAYDDGKGHTAGIDIDVAHAVCDLLHVQLKIAGTDKKSLVTTVEFGKADFALGGLASNENDLKLVDFSNSYVTCEQVIVTRR